MAVNGPWDNSSDLNQVDNTSSMAMREEGKSFFMQVLVELFYTVDCTRFTRASGARFGARCFLLLFELSRAVCARNFLALFDCVSAISIRSYPITSSAL